MDDDTIKKEITGGNTVLGIELGSTRIKSVLIDSSHMPVASGSFEWENRYENGVWTYSLDDVWNGLRASFRSMSDDVRKKYGVPLKTVQSMGISAMMHGYMAFDALGKLLVPFRTWRNTSTETAAKELTKLFSFNVPQRWSVAHLYQAVLNGEKHIGDISFLTTLAGYIHWQLTGKKVLGVGDASGMFPVDSLTGNFNEAMLDSFDRLLQPRGFSWSIRQLLPHVLPAGENAGTLTDEGARLLDPSGSFTSGVPLCPPEGDAGTGMTATNAVAACTGNVSAGTSIFAMIVLKKPLTGVYPEIDIVTTPEGNQVAMVHCNNCTSDLDAWVKLFYECAKLTGSSVEKGKLYDLLYEKALEGDADCGGLVSFNYVSGEHVTGIETGRPLFARMPDSSFTLANCMRTHLYSALATLKIGLDILFTREQVEIKLLVGHGGLFKTPVVGQRIMAGAAGIPVSVMETAAEGGAWGIALLASYASRRQKDESLSNYLAQRVFSRFAVTTIEPNETDRTGFSQFMERYKKALPVEQSASECMK